MFYLVGPSRVTCDSCFIREVSFLFSFAAYTGRQELWKSTNMRSRYHVTSTEAFSIPRVREACCQFSDFRRAAPSNGASRRRHIIQSHFRCRRFNRRWSPTNKNSLMRPWHFESRILYVEMSVEEAIACRSCRRCEVAPRSSMAPHSCERSPRTVTCPLATRLKIRRTAADRHSRLDPGGTVTTWADNVAIPT